MIVGKFDPSGRPVVEGFLTLPRFGITKGITFLVDTGAYATCINPRDGLPARIPFRRLRNPSQANSFGGPATLFGEQAVLEFMEVGAIKATSHNAEVLIAKPNPDPEHSINRLRSVLGRDIIDRWRMLYDRTDNLLEFTVRVP